MNLRNNIFMAFLFSLISLSVLAAVTGPGFSLRNKSKEAIYVDVQKDPGFFQKIKSVFIDEGSKVGTKAPFNFIKADIDTNKKNRIVIYDKNGQKLVSAKFPGGKTLYLNWDDKKDKNKLYPQRGPLFGITGETDEHYSLKNNVKQADIDEAIEADKK